MKQQLLVLAGGICLALAVSSNAQAQLPTTKFNQGVNNGTAAAISNAYRTALSRTPRTGITSIRYNGGTTNMGLSTFTTGANALMMMNGMVPGSPYMNQGYNPYMNQGYNPYMMNPYMMNPYMNQGYNPYMMNPYMMYR